MLGRGPLSGAVRGWQTWAGALGLAVVAVGAAQLLLRVPFIGAGMTERRLVVALVHSVIVLIPVGMYVGWRRAALREADSSRRNQASESRRSDLMNMLVHDLKGPAVTTGMALNALARSEAVRKARTDDDARLLEIAQGSVSRLERMIGDMLNIAAAESGALRLRVGRVDLAALARAAAEEAALLAEEDGVAVNGPSGIESLVVEADVQMVRRVVENLLSNAVRFTPRGGRIDVCVSADSGEALVTVTDSGPGVPPELRERIFEKFGQAEALPRGTMSVGLGLAFCKLAVEAHGGRIWVASSPARGGSAFTFALPMRNAEVAERRSAAPRSARVRLGRVPGGDRRRPNLRAPLAQREAG